MNFILVGNLEVFFELKIFYTKTIFDVVSKLRSVIYIINRQIKALFG